MNEVLRAILRQSTSDTLSTYRAMREALQEEDVAPEQRDIVAATLTNAVMSRMTQVANSHD